MVVAAPLKITLYDDADEAIAEYTCNLIRSRFLRKAIEIQSLQFKEHLSVEEADAVAGLIISIFNNKFTIDQFWDQTVLEEAWAVINSIIARAGNLMGNPPPQEK